MRTELTRRDFITFLNGFLVPMPFFFNKEPLHLKKNSFHNVSPNTMLFMPKSPQKGDFVHLKVSPESALNSSKIIYQNIPILKEKEDLSLDSFGIFKLSFNGKSWDLV